ncbi:unnamed protein product [Didymodactylos carnosus]|uniref:DUF8206 domain-containing protein n=1 Tax=Didymodactylos carnosus TaxID=1234261 RepID=A0A8S2FPA2_9BILA|nr:unnamed protein product [Didymodactylos carnosus]CAF4311051.1 unnamed protein product [Didymodactylos carnosus]
MYYINRNDSVIPHVELIREPLQYPRTVCTNSTCVKYVKTREFDVIDYSTVCHDPYYLRNVKHDTINNPAIQSCEIMTLATKQCRKRKCPWNYHMHISYRTKQEVHYEVIKGQVGVDPGRELVKRMKALREEQETLIKISAVLIQFLKTNSITAFNDPFIDYMNYFVNEERLKHSMGANNQYVLNGLEKLKGLYLQKLQSPMNPSKKDISDLLETLYNLLFNGSSIKDQVNSIKNIQVKEIEKNEKLIYAHQQPEKDIIVTKLNALFSNSRN